MQIAQQLVFPKTVSRKVAMWKAGYVYRNILKDWLRWEGASGRFHAKQHGYNGIKIHYDVYTDPIHHFSSPMPIAIGAEIKRIAGIAMPKKKKKK